MLSCIMFCFTESSWELLFLFLHVFTWLQRKLPVAKETADPSLLLAKSRCRHPICGACRGEGGSYMHSVMKSTVVDLFPFFCSPPKMDIVPQ